MSAQGVGLVNGGEDWLLMRGIAPFMFARLPGAWSPLAHLQLLPRVSSLSPGPASVAYFVLLFFKGEKKRRAADAAGV